MTALRVTYPEKSYATNGILDREGLVAKLPSALYYLNNASAMSAKYLVDLQLSNQVLNINFGGEIGEKLQSLTRIIVHIEDMDAAFVGLAFDYNGESRLFGRQGKTEVSFPIDGSSGERISDITTQRVPRLSKICSIKVCSLET
jgi:hypothetical protein